MNHDALKDAILAVARSKRRKDPVFIDIADAYRHETNRIVSEIERQRLASNTMSERMRMEAEDIRLREIVEKWSIDRLMAAKADVEKKVPSFQGKSSDPSGWSRVFVGMLVAADEALQSDEDSSQ